MANQLHNAFDKIRASEELKSSTLRFLQDERERHGSCQKAARRPAWKPAAASACALLVLLIGLGSWYALWTPISFVSIDVNPSIELTLNRCDRVISADAYNEDGEIVLDGVQVVGQLYTDAIDAIVESDAMQPYLTEDAALTFTVSAADSEKQSALLTGVNDCSGCHAHGGESYTADITSIQTAHDSGLSFGKYTAYLALSQYDDTVTTEDCQTMSMEELHEQISEHESEHHTDSSYHDSGDDNEGASSGTSGDSAEHQESGHDDSDASAGCDDESEEDSESEKHEHG